VLLITIPGTIPEFRARNSGDTIPIRGIPGTQYQLGCGLADC
jgi:hypothetical protein